MKKWVFIVFTASYVLFVWGHPSNHRHTHNRDQYRTPHQKRPYHHQQRKLRRENRRLRHQLNNIINNHYRIHNHPHHDHGHPYPLCGYHGCHIPCTYTLHTCPLITTNIIFPVIPIWFTINIQTSIFHSCQYQYQWCLWNTPFYYQRACTDQYFNCMGYTPYTPIYRPYPYYPYP